MGRLIQTHWVIRGGRPGRATKDHFDLRGYDHLDDEIRLDKQRKKAQVYMRQLHHLSMQEKAIQQKQVELTQRF